MSGIIRASSGLVATGTSLITVLQLLAPAETDLEIVEIYTSGRAAPTSTSYIGLHWRIFKQTTAGTMSAVTEVAWPGASSATAIGTATHTASGEPTSTDEYLDWITPGTPPGYTWRGSLLVPAGTRMGVTVTTPDNQNVLARMLYRRA